MKVCTIKDRNILTKFSVDAIIGDEAVITPLFDSKPLLAARRFRDDIERYAHSEDIANGLIDLMDKYLPEGWRREHIGELSIVIDKDRIKIIKDDGWAI